MLGFFLELFARVGYDAVARSSEKRGNDLSALWRELRQGEVDGRVLLRRIAAAEDTEQNRRALMSAVIGWYGPLVQSLAELAPELYERYKDPGIPVATARFESGREVSREEITVRLATLEGVVRQDVRRIHDLRWELFAPQRLLTLRRGGKRLARVLGRARGRRALQGRRGA